MWVTQNIFRGRLKKLIINNIKGGLRVSGEKLEGNRVTKQGLLHLNVLKEECKATRARWEYKTSVTVNQLKWGSRTLCTENAVLHEKLVVQVPLRAPSAPPVYLKKTFGCANSFLVMWVIPAVVEGEKKKKKQPWLYWKAKVVVCSDVTHMFGVILAALMTRMYLISRHGLNVHSSF